MRLPTGRARRDRERSRGVEICPKLFTHFGPRGVCSLMVLSSPLLISLFPYNCPILLSSQKSARIVQESPYIVHPDFPNFTTLSYPPSLSLPVSISMSLSLSISISISLTLVYFFLNCLKHDAPFQCEFPKITLFLNHSTRIKFRKLTSIQYHYLKDTPHLDFTDCLNKIL